MSTIKKTIGGVIFLFFFFLPGISMAQNPCPGSFSFTTTTTPVTKWGCWDGSITVQVSAPPVFLYYSSGNFVMYITSSNPDYSYSVNSVDLGSETYKFNNLPALPFTVHVGWVLGNNPAGVSGVYNCNYQTQFATVNSPSCSISGNVSASPVSNFDCSDGSVFVTATTDDCLGRYWAFLKNANGENIGSGTALSGEPVSFTYLKAGAYSARIETFEDHAAVGISGYCRTEIDFTIDQPPCSNSITNIATSPTPNTNCSYGTIEFDASSNDCNGYLVNLKDQLSSQVINTYNGYTIGATHVVFNYVAAGNYYIEINGNTPNNTCSYTSPAFAVSCPNNIPITLNLKLFLQGYYTGGGTMQSVLNNQVIPLSLATEADIITIELHDPNTYALVDTKNTVLLTDGTASATFAQPVGEYYIAIRHRNSLQTWSADPIACNSATPLYDFSTAANKAFGDNQVLVEPAVWAFITGDINQDEYIDGNDFPQYDFESASGGSYDGTYTTADMNGDGFVDGNDFPVFDLNSFNGVSSIHP